MKNQTKHKAAYTRFIDNDFEQQIIISSVADINYKNDIKVYILFPEIERGCLTVPLTDVDSYPNFFLVDYGFFVKLPIIPKKELDLLEATIGQPPICLHKWQLDFCRSGGFFNVYRNQFKKWFNEALNFSVK